MVVAQTFPINENTEIPAVGFGTYLVSNDEAATAVSTAISLGYRHIDTAAGYHNEEGIGAGIKAGLENAGLFRDAIFVTTKLWPGNLAWGDEPKTREQTLEAFEVSLNKLCLEYVDLYLIHAPYGGSQRIPQWEALLELKSSGKAKAVGVSNFNPVHLDEIKQKGLPMPDANQVELHPWSQKSELIAYMAEHRITPIAYSSLVPLATWRDKEGQDSAKTKQMKADGNEFREMAKKYGVSEAQLLLRWGVQNGYAVLPKSLNPDRMRENIDLFSFAIGEEDMVAMKTMDRGDGVAWATGDPSKAA